MTLHVVPELLPPDCSNEPRLTFPDNEGWVDSLPAAANKLKAEWQVVFALPCTKEGSRPVILQTTSQERYRAMGKLAVTFELALWILRDAKDCARIPCDTCTVETLLHRHVQAALRHLRSESSPPSSQLALENKAAPPPSTESVGDLCFF
jgi:hypothetical protein